MGIGNLRVAGSVLGLGLGIVLHASFSGAFEPPPRQDAPSSTAGGGSRPTESSCLGTGSVEFQAIALAPQDGIGLSSHAQPTLWLYLPKSGATQLELSLFDSQMKGVAQTELTVTNHQISHQKSHQKSHLLELVPVQFPEQFDLSQDRPYYWSAAVICDVNRRTQDWVVGGWIQYQPISLAHDQAWQALSQVERISQFIKTGYWYDAVTALQEEMSTTSAKSLDAVWENLLKQGAIRLPPHDSNDSPSLQ